MDLFSVANERENEASAPLAFRMRPRSLDEVVGQKSVVGPGTLLRRVIEADRLVSVIFFGPPGTGKTTLAHVIANATKARFETLNAVSSGVADIRRVVQEAQDERKLYGHKTVLFIDEIHRFNKSQQDALLPYVEGGLLVLIGATTENPYFEVNPALVSRSHIFRLEPLAQADVRELLQRALADEVNGLGRLQATLLPEAQAVLIQYAAGDARRALNSLELAAISAPVGADGHPVIDAEQARQSIQERQVLYDKTGDEHYDTISAFIKSVRGSDPDAAVLWLAKMIAAGEDPKFIARRLIILASEDIGNADPHGLPLAVAALHAVEAVGMPEGRIPLAQATTYLASAKKSNAAYKAVNQALADVGTGLGVRVPVHLRGTGYSGAAALGSGQGYLYPHDYPGHTVKQNYWPEGVNPKKYYEPDGDEGRKPD
ncbi:replication-associated recombination protein A [Alicyclobacillus sp. ALC3]|uniref:replication-associated recombination protein A n=1 Tax=Alicyclobacillus sp. ALC3 TaxID=2796143 RepID=UPI00237939D7|nr:replication-associated recombination protein A [Alicyclobacillus sp. ALC3]WDL96301.1 replication-associated recombination protein A [Alicyclobacillus sp. ALC3]